jgi:WD40 repeat protein
VWKAHQAKLVGLAFLPGSGDLLSAGEDGRLCRWAAAGCLETAKEPARAWEVQADRSLLSSFSLQRSGELCATGGLGGDVRVWRTQDGADLHEPSRHGSRVNALEFDPAGEVLLSASADGTACLWDVRSGRRLAVMQGHDGGLLSATFGPDGATFVTTSSDGTARLWSRPPRPSGRRLAADGTAVDFVLLDGGLGLVLRGADEAVQVLGLEDGGRLQRLEGQARAPLQAVACHEKRVLACAGDGWVVEWNASRPEQPIRERRLAQAPLSRLAVASDGSLLSTGHDGQLRVEAAVDQSIRTVLTSERALVVLELSEDRRRAVTGGMEGAVWLWDVGAPAARLLHRGHRGHVQVLAVSRDGRYVLSGGRDRLAILWDVDEDRQVAVLRGHEAEISGVDIDRQGRRAVTGGDDGSVGLWTLATGSLERALAMGDGHRRDAHVRFFPSGELLLTWGADGVLRVWSVETGRLLYVLEGHASPVGGVTLVAGGAGAVSNDGSGSLWSWDLSLESRAPSALREIVARYVPWRLDGAGRLVPSR